MNKTLVIAVALSSAFVVSAVQAAPVSLACQVVSGADGIKDEFVFQLSEETESATYMMKTGEVVRWKAIFTADKVVFGGGDFIIDRATLSFTRIRQFAGEYEGTDVGTCALSTVKKAF